MCTFTLGSCLLWLAVIVVVLCLLVKLYLCHAGTEIIVPLVDSRTAFKAEEVTDNSMVLTTDIGFENQGKQCATIMDAFVRPQLPYEQYDGIEVRAKAEREGEIREDDYFEAVIIQKKGYVRNEDHLNVYAKVKLLPRKGLSLNEALSHMVDLPLDFIWQETGRTPWHYRKLRLVITAEEIAKLAGVELVKD